MTDRRDLKERILGAVSIDTYIGRYVTLKKQGKYYKGLCPFHNEKTPSFTVTPEKGLYHCFGCGKGGDLINFVMDMEGLTFPEALESLARFAGIDYDLDPSKGDHQRKLEDLNLQVMRKFQEFFLSPPAASYRNYLQSRGIRKESVEKFGIGGAPDEWRWITALFPSKHAELKELGLIRESKGNTYDFFRGRILFPIQDQGGKVIGFGGRSLPGKDQEAKYINSTDSVIFHKGRILYGMFQSAAAIRKEKVAYLVEGYLDVIGLHEAGVPAALAPLGTAVTPDHLVLLKKMVDQITFLLDGDRAGRAAALKSARLAVEAGGVGASVVLLPEGMDPFDVSRFYPDGGMASLLKDGIPAERFVLVETILPERIKPPVGQEKGIDGIANFVNSATRMYRHGVLELELSIAEKRTALIRLRELIAGLQRASDRELFMSEGGKILGLSMEALRQEFQELQRPGPGRPEFVPPGREPGRPASGIRRPAPVVKNDPRVLIERRLLIELIHVPAIFSMFHGVISEFDFQDEHSELLWRFLETRYLNGEVWSPEMVAGAGLPAETLQVLAPFFLDKEAESLYSENGETGTDPAHIVEDLILDHRIRGLRIELDRMRNNLRLATGAEYDTLVTNYQSSVLALKELESKKSGEKRK